MEKLKIIARLIALIFLWRGPQAQANAVVVVSAGSKVSTLTNDELGKIFLGKQRSIGGSNIVPADRKDSAIREYFHKNVTGKSLEVLKKYWARKVFSGEDTPPVELESDNEVKEWLSKHPNGVSYMNEKNVDASVRIVRQIQQP